MFCNYELQPDGHYKCTICGDIAQRLTSRNCGPPAPAPPPLFSKLKNFTRAAIAHAMSGFPSCTQAEIDVRYGICIGCEFYKPDGDNPVIGVCAHKDCGCGISNQAGFVAKLAWADQHCPIEKW